MAPRKPESRSAGPADQSTFPIIGIGASAGGLEAFSDLLRDLPEKTGMAFVLVQHLDPKHSSGLGGILARTTNIPVQEVTDGARVQPNQIYVIPPNNSMVLKDGTLRLAPRVLSRGQHLPIDHFFRSLAKTRGNRAIGVILSGSASDGTEGCRAIKAAGGITFAQDEQSAKFASMPRSAVSTGCIDFVLPPGAIARELSRLAKHPYVIQPSAEEAEPAMIPEDHMQELLSALRDATGVDFTHYKQTTLQRRIKRRMVVHRLENLKEYVRFVRNTPGEIEDLYQDILIHVTEFFRDPAAFDALRQQVLPQLFQQSKTGTVRVWVPGCSTGEEVYSLAMVMLEYLWEKTQKTAKAPLGSVPFQIFATDISETSLNRARSGLYSDGLVAAISPERLRRFFNRLDGGYQIVKPVREMCIFAKQNLLKDPPFSNLDLISCRNLLIYLGPVLQKRVIPTLHYALKPDGYLMLGESESLGAYSEYFIAMDKKRKIFQKKKSATRLASYFGSLDFGVRRGEAPKPAQPSQSFEVEKELDRLLMSRFVPASVVVNDDMEIVHLRGKTGPYLEPAAGHPTFSLSKMAREGLLVDLRAALTKAKKENVTVRREGVHVQSDGHSREVNLEVAPLLGASPRERYYVIVFQEGTPASADGRKGKKQAPKGGDGVSPESAQIKRELEQLREQFQSLIEEHETTSEEFKSANEEVLSANEELQSTNEELETAKEELQSTNEELTTLNEELQNRNVELTTANNDLLNLLGNVSAPVVMVDQELRIRRFTPPAQKLLNLLPGDVGRRLTEIRPNLEIDDLGMLARETIESVIPQEREVQEKGSGAWFQMRVRPYKTWDSKIDGAVISFQDVDSMKRNLEQSRDYANALIENAREPIVMLDASLRVVSANKIFYRQFEVKSKETEGQPFYKLGNGQWNTPKLRELLEKVLPDNGTVADFEVRHSFPHLGKRTMMLNARRVEPVRGQQFVLLYIEDVT
jgi:two-component system CheB/CheR fusion protein